VTIAKVSGSLEEPTETPPLRLWRIFLAPAVALAVYLLPLGLPADAHRLLAIVVLAVCFWITEAIPAPVTALLAPALAVLVGIGSVKTVFAPFSDPVIFLFIGSFMVAEAMRVHGLDRRVALAILSQPWASRSAGNLLLTIGFVTCVISLWVSNTATTAMMLPIGLGLLRALGRDAEKTKSPYAIAMMLMLTWSSSVAIGLPIASPPNLIAIGMSEELTRTPITFAGWTMVTMPMTAAMLLLCFVLLRWLYRDDSVDTAGLGDYVRREREQLGPWTTGERSVAFAFVLLSLLWFVPAIATAVLPNNHPAAVWMEAHLPESTSALYAAALLFFLPGGNGRPALEWPQAKQIDWGTVILFGGGLSLGKLMFDTKLAAVMGGGFTGIFGFGGLWGITAAAIIMGIVVSEAASNTASANAVIPVAIAAANALGVSPLPPIFGAALGASFGFMLPVATPPNAIVYASGLVPLRQMMRAGIWLDVTGAVTIWIFLRLLCPLLGMA
jgi:solute carrier family 13 (sodium-dependent dicarboxylate transporter), member 2/3/5